MTATNLLHARLFKVCGVDVTRIGVETLNPERVEVVSGPRRAWHGVAGGR